MTSTIDSPDWLDRYLVETETPDPPPQEAIARAVVSAGFCFQIAPACRPVSPHGDEWAAFVRLWDSLPEDPYMQPGDRFRQRRFGRFHVAAPVHVERSPYTPYTEDENGYAPLVRAFPELTDVAYADPVLRNLIVHDAGVFNLAAGQARRWDVGIHMIRTTATAERSGQPTPEGVHRDDNTYFAVHLVRRDCEGAVSRFYDLDKRQIHKATLKDPLDSVYVDDAAVFHDVTPIPPTRATATRDILIVDFYG